MKNSLFKCGLNESEQKIFIYLMRYGMSIASLIAKRIGIKRPTVYAALNNLIKIGIIVKHKKANVTYFSALSPHMISKILEDSAKQKFEEIKYASKLIEPQLLELSQKKEKDFGDFEIEALETKGGVYIQLEEVLLGGDFDAIFNPQKALIGSYKELVAKFLKETAKTEPYIREIVVSGPAADWYKNHIQNKNHLIKEIPVKRKILSDMMFIDGSVVLSHYELNKEVSIKITQKDYFQSMLTIFEMLWEKI